MRRTGGLRDRHWRLGNTDRNKNRNLDWHSDGNGDRNRD